MVFQVIQTSLLIILITVLIIGIHKGLGHEPSFFIKATEVLIILAAAITFIGALFVGIWS